MSDPPPETPREDPDRGVDEAPLFQHPQWMVGVVVIFGVAAIVAGMSQPIWWLVGSPFILVLLIVIWVRLRGL